MFWNIPHTSWIFKHLARNVSSKIFYAVVEDSITCICLTWGLYAASNFTDRFIIQWPKFLDKTKIRIFQTTILNKQRACSPLLFFHTKHKLAIYDIRVFTFVSWFAINITRISRVDQSFRCLGHFSDIHCVLRSGLNLLVSTDFSTGAKHSRHRETEVKYFHHFNYFLSFFFLCFLLEFKKLFRFL